MNSPLQNLFTRLGQLNNLSNIPRSVERLIIISTKILYFYGGGGRVEVLRKKFECLHLQIKITIRSFDAPFLRLPGARDELSLLQLSLIHI